MLTQVYSVVMNNVYVIDYQTGAGSLVTDSYKLLAAILGSDEINFTIYSLVYYKQ